MELSESFQRRRIFPNSVRRVIPGERHHRRSRPPPAEERQSSLSQPKNGNAVFVVNCKGPKGEHEGGETHQNQRYRHQQIEMQGVNGEYGKGQAGTGENRAEKRARNAVAKRKSLEPGGKNVQTSAIGNGDEQFREGRAVNASVAHKPPRQRGVNGNGREIQYGFQIGATERLNGSERDDRESVDEENQGYELQNHGALGGKLRAEPHVQYVSREKDEDRGRRREHQEKVFHGARGDLGNLGTLAAPVITEKGEERRHDAHGENEQLGNELIRGGVERKHGDGKERSDHEALEIAEHWGGHVGDHDPPAEGRQGTKGGTRHVELGAQTRNNAKAKGEISKSRDQTNGNQERDNPGNMHTERKDQRRDKIKEHARRHLDVVHEVEALRGLEHSAQGVVCEHDGHRGAENKERDLSFSGELRRHFEKMRHGNGNKQCR